MSIRADLVTEYVQSQELYSKVVKMVASKIEKSLKSEGIDAEVTGREKDPWSLATKLLTKERGGTPYQSLAEIPDLAGVRVISKHTDDFEAARQVIRNLFPDALEDDKSAQLDPETFRYRGVHFQVAPIFKKVNLNGLCCEIQLRTKAEHLWSDLSHELFYKTPGPVSDNLKRRFNRLIALIELFDMEVKGTMEELSLDPSNEQRRMLSVLETYFAESMPVPVGINRELSLELITSMEHMKPLREGFDELSPSLAKFVDTNRTKLKIIYRRLQSAPGHNPFFMQPESLLIWYLIETCKYEIMEEWANAEWDPALLGDLSNEWGTILPD